MPRYGARRVRPALPRPRPDGDLGRLGVDPRRGRGRGRHDGQLDDLDRGAGRGPAPAGRAPTGSTGSTGPRATPTTPRSSAELAVTSRRPILPPKDATAPPRRHRARARGRPDATRNDVGCGACGSCPFGCRAGAKRSGSAGPPGRRLPGRRPDRRRRPRRAGARRGRPAPSGVEATVGWEAPSARAAARGLRPVERRALVVRARQVVLAAGALRTPVVLERSGIGHPAARAATCCVHPVSVVAGPVRRADRHVARPAPGGPLARLRRRGPRPERLRRRVGPGSSGPDRPGLAVGGDRRARGADGAGSATSRRSSRSPATAGPDGSGRPARAARGSTTGSIGSGWRRCATGC